MNTSTTEASVQFRSIESRTRRRVETIGNRLQWLEGQQIDSDARLMDESLQLRYQVYNASNAAFSIRTTTPINASATSSIVTRCTLVS